MIRRSVYSPDVHPFIKAQSEARAIRPRLGLPPADLRAFALAAPAPRLKVVIVGAGLAGLCAAYELEQRNHEVVLLEADGSHLGGRVRTLDLGDGLRAEAGAMRIPRNHLITRHYVRELGLPLRKFVQSNDQAYYYVRGRRVRIKDDATLKSLFSLTAAETQMSLGDMWNKAIVRLLEGLIEPEREDLYSDVLDTTNVRALDQRTLQQLLEATGLSEEAIDYLSSTWGYETLLPCAATEVLREELKAIWSPDFDEICGGTDRLPKAFAAKLKSRPRQGCEVFRIEQTTKAVSAVYRDANGTDMRAEGDVLLCTLPLPVLSRIEIVPRLSGPKTQAIRQINYDSSTKVLAVSRRRFWEEDDDIFGGGSATDLPTGFTYYPSDNAGARDRAVSAQPAAMLASYTWGQPARRMAALSNAEAGSVVTQNLAKLHPQIRCDKPIERTVMWSWDNFKWSSGAFAWFQPGQHTTLHKDLVRPECRIFFAGEHTSLDHTWMQGALESAQRAVLDITAFASHSATA